jgi:hypothetical protein
MQSQHAAVRHADCRLLEVTRVLQVVAGVEVSGRFSLLWVQTCLDASCIDPAKASRQVWTHQSRPPTADRQLPIADRQMPTAERQLQTAEKQPPKNGNPQSRPLS